MVFNHGLQARWSEKDGEYVPERLGYNTNVKLAKPTHLADLANNLAHVRRAKAIAFEKDTLTKTKLLSGAGMRAYSMSLRCARATSRSPSN